MFGIRTLTSILILLPFHFLDAGSKDPITGTWIGTSTYGKEVSELEITFEQVENIISGIVFVRKPNADFIRYKIDGAIKGARLTLKSYETIEKQGKWWCLPAFDLLYEKINDQELLTGKWKHNFIKGGCLLGVSGNVKLIKSRATQNTVTTINDDEHDQYTTRMIEGLQKRNYHALVIAVQDYEDPEMLDLDHPVSDAQSLISVLIDKYSFGQDNVNFLRNPTRSEVIDQLDEYSSQLGVNDNLLVFYAGHGIWDSDIEQGFWLPSNAKKESKADWISNGTIRDYLKAIDTKHTLLITDACFSGGILKERNAFTEGKAMTYLYRMPSRKAMTSGTLTTVPDRSVFIEYLVKNLERNEDPLLSAEQLFYSIKMGVINNSPNGQVPQYGVVFGARDEGGDFIFLKN